MENKVKCMNCGKQYKQINAKHIKKCCGFTFIEYKMKYPESNTISKNTFINFSNCRKGNKNGMFGKNHSQESIKNISKNRKNKCMGKNNVMYMYNINFKGQNGPSYKFIDFNLLLTLVRSNLSKIEIMKRLNITQGTLERKLKEANINWNIESSFKQGKGKNNPAYKFIDYDKLILLVRSGISKIAIARKLNINFYTLKRKLDEYDINWDKESSYEIETICPNYNPDACKFFDKLNEYMNWNGQHALNDGEYHISELGYWVDYYNSNLNLVIEWDENHHYKNGELKKKDKIRQNQIENYLNCKFIRIKENEFKNFDEILLYIQNKFYEEVI